MTETIYLRLIDEGVDVWRPVRATYLNGDVYRIDEQPYDREDEQWEFGPGDTVECRVVTLDEGPALVAIKKIQSTA